MPDEIAERYCKDCRWSRHIAWGTDWESWKCHNPKQLPRPRRRNLDDGKMEQPLWRECERLRRDKISGINTTLIPRGAEEAGEFLRNPTCGPEGKWWEPKERVTGFSGRGTHPMTRSARDALAEMFDGDIQQADRILSRLAEEGFVVVPREPTEAMLKAARVFGSDYEEDMAKAESLWKHMIDAALAEEPTP